YTSLVKCVRLAIYLHSSGKGGDVYETILKFCRDRIAHGDRAACHIAGAGEEGLVASAGLRLRRTDCRECRRPRRVLQSDRRFQTVGPGREMGLAPIRSGRFDVQL